MELIEAIRELKGNPALVPDCPRGNLPKFFVEMGYKTGAEIGVYKAGFTEKFCQVGLRMFAIDPWMAYEGSGRTQQVQDRQDFLYGHACRTLAPYGDLAVIIRKTSLDALADFKNGSLDFVYIDGNHEFPYVAMDAYEWSKKVRKGGVVAGHDYFNTSLGATNLICHGKAAVDAYTALFEIDNWWIFGEDRQARDKDDRYFSWMWIKK